MKYLPMPPDAGDAVIHKQCKKPTWHGYRDRWLAAAASYRSACGNPWVISPAKFADDERESLRKLYDTRRNGGPIARIRRPENGFPSCPMCGSSGGRSLDHALPRSDFPEFSILRENLVPACTICNSDEKGANYRGTGRSQRLIHPYYDSWASDPIWLVEFGDDLEAVTLHPRPVDGIPVTVRPTVEYHLSQVLGSEWQESARRYWGSLPAVIQQRYRSGIAVDAVKDEISLRLECEILEYGFNGWRPAFLRGVLKDDRMPKYLSGAVSRLPRIP